MYCFARLQQQILCADDNTVEHELFFLFEAADETEADRVANWWAVNYDMPPRPPHSVADASRFDYQLPYSETVDLSCEQVNDVLQSRAGNVCRVVACGYSVVSQRFYETALQLGMYKIDVPN